MTCIQIEKIVEVLVAVFVLIAGAISFCITLKEINLGLYF